jgi:hypothetical protein
VSQFTESADSPPLLALIGDLVGSRRQADRARQQTALLEAVEQINRGLASGELAAALRVTAGDEVQVLLWEPAAAVEVIRGLSDVLHPEAIVFGLGLGSLSTHPSLRPPERVPDVALADGSCLHRARAALERAKGRGAWAEAEGLGEVPDAALGALFELMGQIRSGWTRKQAAYSAAARTRLQKEVAEAFGVSPSVVSESLKAARHDSLARGEEAARRLLSVLGTKETP